MSKVMWKPGTLEAPVPPTLVSCGTLENPNVLTIAWTGIINTQPPMTYISVRPERFSYNLIKDSGEFVINLTTQSLVRVADFCGVRSGKDIDKFAAAGLTPEKAGIVSAPLIEQSPISLECRVKEIVHLGSHDMFMAEIVAVDIDPSMIDSAGKLRMERCGLVAYAHGSYYALGKCLGTFGYSVRKKSSPKRRKK